MAGGNQPGSAVVTMDLSGRRVLVVGASSGIGRAFACRAVQAGARTVLAARRLGLLEEAIDEAAGGVAVVGDVSDPADCNRIVAEAVGVLRELDLVVLAAGSGSLGPVLDAEAEQWSSVLATNVVGLNQVVRAAVPQMAAAGLIAALSSESVGRPRMGLGPYSASKAALDQSFLSWQLEHPEVRFCRVTVGATQPTGFGSEFGADVLDASLRHWVRHGEMQQRFMPVGEVADLLLTLLASALANPGVNVEHLRLRSPSGTVSSLDEVEF
jgi:NAD(P)-dependent dehydrogenase (short-subunit alcohol dehydrogenase family)